MRQGNLRRGMPQQTQIKVDINSLPDLECPICKSTIFKQYLKLKKISALQSGTGKEAVYPVVITVCKECETQLLLDNKGNLNPVESKEKEFKNGEGGSA